MTRGQSALCVIGTGSSTESRVSLILRAHQTDQTQAGRLAAAAWRVFDEPCRLRFVGRYFIGATPVHGRGDRCTYGLEASVCVQGIGGRYQACYPTASLEPFGDERR